VTLTYVKVTEQLGNRSMPEAAGPQEDVCRGLLALDFDNTLVTDVPEQMFLPWLSRMADKGEKLPRHRGIRDITVYQNEVFAFACRKGFDIGDVLRQAEFKYLTDGMHQLLETAKNELKMKVR